MQQNTKYINGILLHILYGFRPMPQDMADSIGVQHVAMLHSCQSSNGSRTGSSSLILGKSSSSGSSARKLCQSLGRGGRTISPFSLRLIKTSSAFILRSLFSLLFLVGTKKGPVAPLWFRGVSGSGDVAAVLAVVRSSLPQSPLKNGQRIQGIL